MKKIIVILMCKVATAVFVMVGSASAVEVDAKTHAVEVDTISHSPVRPMEEQLKRRLEKQIAEMQKEMIRKNFTARLLKNQMRTKMMAELVPQRFLQNSIQPVIAERARTMILPVIAEQVRAIQMKALMTR